MSWASHSSKDSISGSSSPGDVGDPFPVDLVDPADELGPLRPGDDLDALGRVDRGAPSPGGRAPPSARGRSRRSRDAPRRRGSASSPSSTWASRASSPCAAAQRESSTRSAEPSPRPRLAGGTSGPDDGLRLPRLLHAEADRDELAALEREQVHLLGAPPSRSGRSRSRSRRSGTNGVAELEPALELGVVADRADLGHAATIRPNTYGGDLVSTWSVLRQSCKPRSPVGLVNPPGNQVSADNELALAA